MTYVVIIKLAWWYKYFYFPGVSLFAGIFNAEINEDKFTYYTKKALTLKYIQEA